MTSFTLAPSASVGNATDAHGNPMTGDADTIERYDRTIDRLVRFHPEAIDLATELAGQDTPAPMAHALIAYLHLMSTDPADLATARDAYEALIAGDGNAREQAHAAAIGAWQGGDWTAAARRLDELLIRWPGDLLALMLGHQLDFFLGDAQSLRDRPIRSLRELGDHPHAPFVHGMAAFGLEESGHYGQALDAGLAAVEANADDVWAIHAVVHTYEMQGRVDDGITFMTSDSTQMGVGQPVHRPQLVAPGDLPARGRTPGAGARHLRRRDPPRRLARRADRDARRQRAAVADAARRNRHRWTVRSTRRRLGPEGRGRAVVRVQRPARHDGVDRRRPAGRGARRDQPARPLARRRLGHERPDDGRDRPAGVPRRHRLRRGSSRRRDRRPDADPPQLPALRWLARSTRRAPADAAGVGAAFRTVRAGTRADRRAARRARDQRLRLGPAGTGPARPGRRDGAAVPPTRRHLPHPIRRARRRASRRRGRSTRRAADCVWPLERVGTIRNAWTRQPAGITVPTTPPSRSADAGRRGGRASTRGWSTLTRFGWIAKGVVYALMGLTAFTIGRQRPTSDDASPEGAVAQLACDARAARPDLVAVWRSGSCCTSSWRLLLRRPWSAAASVEELAGPRRLPVQRRVLRGPRRYRRHRPSCTEK